MQVLGLRKPNKFPLYIKFTPIGAKNGAETKKSHESPFQTAPEKLLFLRSIFHFSSFSDYIANYTNPEFLNFALTSRNRGSLLFPALIIYNHFFICSASK